jgi:hypothetical protein
MSVIDWLLGREELTRLEALRLIVANAKKEDEARVVVPFRRPTAGSDAPIREPLAWADATHHSGDPLRLIRRFGG